MYLIIFILLYVVFILLIARSLIFFGYVPNERNHLMLLIEDYAFNNCTTNKNGMVIYRCYYQTDGVKCHSSCTIEWC